VRLRNYNIPWNEYEERIERAYNRGSWGEIYCMLREMREIVEDAKAIIRKNNKNIKDGIDKTEDVCYNKAKVEENIKGFADILFEEIATLKPWYCTRRGRWVWEPNVSADSAPTS